MSSESSARQRIHLESQVLFSSKDKSKKLKCRLLQFLLGALRDRTRKALNFHLYQMENKWFSGENKWFSGVLIFSALESSI